MSTRAPGIERAKHAGRARGVADGVTLGGARLDREHVGRADGAGHHAIPRTNDPVRTGQSADARCAGHGPCVRRTKEARIKSRAIIPRLTGGAAAGAGQTVGAGDGTLDAIADSRAIKARRAGQAARRGARVGYFARGTDCSDTVQAKVMGCAGGACCGIGSAQ